MKKINENYDDYMQKYYHEDTPMKDILSGEQIISSSPIQRFFNRVFLGFKPLSDCVSDATENSFFKMGDGEVFTFNFRNSQYHLSVNFEFTTEEICNFCVFYQPIYYDGDESVDLFSPGDCMHIGDYVGKNAVETCKILQDTFEVLLKKLGFNKEWTTIQDNRLVRGN